MQSHPYSNTIVLIFITLSSLTITNQNDLNYLPLWTWKCVRVLSTCVPSKPDGILQSLATCNMICTQTQLWPQPTGAVRLSSVAVPVRSDLFKLQTLAAPSQAVRTYIRSAFSLMKNDLDQLVPSPQNQIEWRELLVNIKVVGSPDPRMLTDTDESYRLIVKPTDVRSLSIDIEARSFCGARHALETLSQLVWWDPYVGSLMTLDAALVEDTPCFPYRGLMLDTARNYFPVADLLRTVDAMGANKLNTFHWHASDAHAFSLLLKSAPRLAMGALGAGAVYSPNDVRTVVQRARLRGVRVLLELDTPARVGRAWDWGREVGYGALAHCSDEPFCDDPPCGQINPRNSLVYTLLQNIYAEIINITGVDDVFHLGGDDVSERCWQEHFNGTGWMDLLIEFTQNALQRLKVANAGRMPNLTLIWMSPLSDSVKNELKNYIPYLGLQMRSFSEMLKLGTRIVLSNEFAWDFNSGTGPWYESHRNEQYNSWQRVYEYRPWSQGAEGVEGGEGTVWSTDLGLELDARVWPRAAALAERLWSDGPESVTRAVWARLGVHCERLAARGFHPAPIYSSWCLHDFANCWNNSKDRNDNFATEHEPRLSEASTTLINIYDENQDISAAGLLRRIIV